MTRLLEHAITAARTLPDLDQDAIAALILEQIADDRAWDEAFDRSQTALARLAAKVREDIAAGRVRRLVTSSKCPTGHEITNVRREAMP